MDDLGANTGGSEPYTTFFVTMPDGQTYHGECIDHGSYIPLAGDYPFTGTWNGTSYDIIVESRYFADTREDVCPEERPNFDLYGQGYTQRVGNFTYMPYGYVRIVKLSADPALTDGNALYSLAGAEFTVYGQDGSMLGTLTTGEDGTTGTLEVPAGQTVTIRETPGRVSARSGAGRRHHHAGDRDRHVHRRPGLRSRRADGRQIRRRTDLQR